MLSTYIKENKNSLFSSIVFLLFGIILFTNPGGILAFLSYIAGGILIAIGVSNILSYNKTLKHLNIEDKPKLISGIIIVILGISVILFSSFIETTIRLICGGWIIYTGITRLIEAINNKTNQNTYIASLVIAVLMISCGFFVALTTNLVFSLIGLFIMIYAILDISEYIIQRKKTN